jgi:hypothetical protein
MLASESVGNEGEGGGRSEKDAATQSQGWDHRMMVKCECLFERKRRKMICFSLFSHKPSYMQ